MTNEELQSYLTERFPEAEIKPGPQYVEMIVTNAALNKTARQLKQLDEISFDYLFCLTGVDYAENMGIVYHLDSTVHRHMMVLKVRTADRVNPVIDTVSDVWITAKYHEREAYDLLGIHFNNHTDLRPLYYSCCEW